MTTKHDEIMKSVYNGVESIRLDKTYKQFLYDSDNPIIHNLVLSALGMNILLNPNKEKYRAMIIGKMIMFKKEDNSFRIYHMSL